MLYFVSTVSMSHWDWNSLIMFLGFANQAASIFDVFMIEFARVLLLKFGGKDSKWGPAELEVVPEYFGLLFSRFAEGRVRNHACAGFQITMCLLTFNSDRLQNLLLSDRRSEALCRVRQDRHDVIKDLLRPEFVGMPRQQRIKQLTVCLELWQQRLSEENTRCLAHTCGGKPNRKACSDLMQLAERTRLLAMIQAHVAELSAATVDELESDDSSEDGPEEEEEDETRSDESEDLEDVCQDAHRTRGGGSRDVLGPPSCDSRDEQDRPLMPKND